MIVFAADLALSCSIEQRTDGSIRKFVNTARCYRTIQIQARAAHLHSRRPDPDDLRQAVNQIHGRTVAH